MNCFKVLIILLAENYWTNLQTLSVIMITISVIIQKQANAMEKICLSASSFPPKKDIIITCMTDH